MTKEQRLPQFLLHPSIHDYCGSALHFFFLSSFHYLREKEHFSEQLEQKFPYYSYYEVHGEYDAVIRLRTSERQELYLQLIEDFIGWAESSFWVNTGTLETGGGYYDPGGRVSWERSNSNLLLIELFLFRCQFLSSKHLQWLLSVERGLSVDKKDVLQLEQQL